MKKLFKIYSLFLIMIISVLMLTTFGSQKVEAASPGSIVNKDTYYTNVDTSSGQKLIESLTTIVSTGAVDIGYDAVWDAFEYTDLKPRNDGKKIIWDMYSNYDFTFRTDQAGNYSGEGDKYNREHSVPKSWFNDARPMHNDIFHLYPTDGAVNGMRSNYPFGETNSPTKTSLNGSKLGPSSHSLYSGTGGFYR